MFGYINVCRGELKIKEYDTFKAYYCGLCRRLGEDYSQKARLLLNYDCTFLYLLSDALAEQQPKYSPKRCVIHPVKKSFSTDGAGAEYAAAVNVLLGAESVKDHAVDKGSAAYKSAYALLSADRKKAEEKYPAVARLIRERTDALHKLEAQRSADIDAAANEFAMLLEGIFSELNPELRPLKVLGHELGRWIYIIDALDDFEKDVKSGSYNPLVERFGKELSDEVKKCAEFNLNSSVSGAALALDLLELNKHEGIIENIIHLGLYEKMKVILKNGKERDGSL